MPEGPGKYDSLCTRAREGAGAQGAVLIIIGGSKGNGFSIQSRDPELVTELPAILRTIAALVQKEISSHEQKDTGH